MGLVDRSCKCAGTLFGRLIPVYDSDGWSRLSIWVGRVKVGVDYEGRPSPDRPQGVRQGHQACRSVDRAWSDRRTRRSDSRGIAGVGARYQRLSEGVSFTIRPIFRPRFVRRVGSQAAGKAWAPPAWLGADEIRRPAAATRSHRQVTAIRGSHRLNISNVTQPGRRCLEAGNAVPKPNTPVKRRLVSLNINFHGFRKPPRRSSPTRRQHHLLAGTQRRA